uniref:USP domain-containing protein n=1 Tax=Macrostomum lignano TaxID=282301 RepID=A0A1I8JNH7_9PLAT
MHLAKVARLAGAAVVRNEPEAGRVGLIRWSLTFLLSLAFSCREEIEPVLTASDSLCSWLQATVLDCLDGQTRREVVHKIVQLCSLRSTRGVSCRQFAQPLLICLLRFLPKAAAMKPAAEARVFWRRRQRRRLAAVGASVGCGAGTAAEPDKADPFGPNCTEYFNLVTRLLDLQPQQQQQQLADVTNQVIQLLRARECHERHRCGQAFPIVTAESSASAAAAIHDEDEVLIGLLRLAQHLMQRCPQLKAGIHANFMRDVFDYLFALPSAQQRHLPKCKSTAARSNAIDLLVELAKGGNGENYLALVDWLQLQHTQHCHDPYGWDYWPQDEGRAACGYVGITNLGATEALLQACNPVKHAEILAELKKLFAFLQESQRRALNPRGFCRVYSMNRQSLNTGEQKDMTEFFNDLIAKLEEMTPERPSKDLFCGVLTNSVVSQDCPHVRHTLEEFYCVRCEVHGVKNLYQSLDKLCVTDLLEGENMYRCSGCDCKVKAEKRVIHYYGTDAAESSSSPADQQQQQREEVVDKDDEMQPAILRAELPTVAEQEAQGFVYELIGSTADGGHYYSYIRDRLSPSVGDADRWLWFNDSEVRPFDPSQIPVECFGGEVSSKAYDSMQDRFMDFSFERTNSAYMLFYEHVPSSLSSSSQLPLQPASEAIQFDLPPDLADACGQDNKSYLQDRNIFNHMYFNFMFQVCAYLRNTVPSDDQVFFKTARLTCSFILETLVHAKEKLNLVQWIEIMDKMLILCRQQRGQCSVEQRALIADLLRLFARLPDRYSTGWRAGGGGLDRAEHSCFAPYFNSMTLCLVSADENE